MLDHLGETEAAADLDAAVSSVLGAGAPDTTSGWDDALRSALSATAGAR
jgi:isocitrate/isopropylmalate dehydrogenase